jgi:hypothetical protein
VAGRGAKQRWSWIGGHGTDPYEQKTQQSPGFGRSIAPQYAVVEEMTRSAASFLPVTLPQDGHFNSLTVITAALIQWSTMRLADMACSKKRKTSFPR